MLLWFSLIVLAGATAGADLAVVVFFIGMFAVEFAQEVLQREGLM